MKVNLIYNRIPHHATHSGYDRVGAYLAGRMPVRMLDDYMARLISDSAWAWIADKSGGWMTRRSGLAWYDTYAFSLEAAAAWSSVWRRNEIYHHLYGENTYRYLGSIAPLIRAKGHKLVCSYHQPPDIFEKVVGPKRLIEQLDAIIAVAQSQAAYFAGLAGADRVFVVPLGVDTEFFQPAEQRPSEAVQCLFVGQWLRDFTALAAVVREIGKRDRRIRFKVITHPDRAAAFTGLSNVEAVSGVSDAELLAAYQAADVLLLPFTDCTANCALLEGMACGLPVVTTDVGGVRDYVDPTCALLAPPGDVARITEDILALAGDTARRLQMGRQSRLRALAFRWETVADKLVQVYNELADGSVVARTYVTQETT
jgi:glycosyltransferase involved in cell wall biosynthesis